MRQTQEFRSSILLQGAIEIKKRQLICALRCQRRLTLVACQEIAGGNTKDGGNASQVGSDLPRAIGFPLRHGATGDTYTPCQLLLS